MKRVYLLITFAILLEVVGVAGMKASQGFTRLLPTVILILGHGGSLALYIYIARNMEIGLLYALWSGLATAAVALVGIALFHEPMSPIKLAGLAVTIVGVVGLTLTLNSGRAAHPRPDGAKEGGSG